MWKAGQTPSGGNAGWPAATVLITAMSKRKTLMTFSAKSLFDNLF
jgi:hypothetical protein